ncbi:MAG: RluA family pseudouridine synthase [Clostridiales bacterium]|nr:RluA family pseudouridine synthase [Clostridiales bacterium]
MQMHITVLSDENGKKIYDILRDRLQMSNLLCKRIRLYGELYLNGFPARMIAQAEEGDDIFIIYDDAEGIIHTKPDTDIKIYYEDEWIIVCEKPGNLVTHPSWQHMDDSLLQRLCDTRLHPIMRLDRETSGLIVIAKNGYAHNTVSKNKMEKEYIGIVYGAFEPEEGTIDLPIGRDENSIMIRIVREDGHPSVTHYKTLRTLPERNLSVVSYKLETGRCHQIRVHSRHLGHPLVGDGLYGPRSNDFPDPDMLHIENEDKISRQALHACKLGFYHPITNEWMEFSSEMPSDMQALLS